MRDFLQEYTIRFYFEWSWIDDIDTTAKILRFRRLPQRSENQYSSWHDLSWFGLFIRDYWLRKDWPHCRLQLKWLYSERSFFFSSCNQAYNNCKSLLLLRLGDYVVHCVTRSLRSVKERLLALPPFEHICMSDCCKVKLKNLPTNRHLTNASVSF